MDSPASPSSAQSSKNDIFLSSWRARAAPPPPLPVASLHPAMSGLGRSKSTGSTWRSKVRTALDNGDLDATTPRMDSELPVFVIPSSESESRPRTSVPDSRTSSFFDIKHKPLPPLQLTLDRPISPALSATTATLSQASSLSSNPSLSAALPFSPTTTPPSASPANDPRLDVELRLYPTPEYRLGEGRYSSVYLAGYRRGKAFKLDEEGVAWKLCAVKKLSEDEEAQRLGLREAWILRQLSLKSEHPGQVYVVRLLGLQTAKIDEEKGATPGHKSRPSLPQSLLHQTLDKAVVARHTRHGSLEEDVSSAHLLSPSPPLSKPSQPRQLHLVLPYAPSVMSELIRTKPLYFTPYHHTRISHQLAQAISFVHSQGILHTDIKPHNVLLTIEFDVLLSDFNTSIHIPSVSVHGLPDDPAGLGTPVYSPPEFNKPPPSPFSYPSDIWSLGVTLMVGILGREPYARLLNGKRGKGGRQQLKIWLGKGAYWQYEAQEREELEGSPLLSPPPPMTIDGEEILAVGVEQLRQVLDDPSAPESWLEVTPPGGVAEQEPVVVSNGQPLTAPTDFYDDGTARIRYLGGSPDHTVSQRMYSLFRSMCEVYPVARPTIDSIVQVLEEELAELKTQA